MIWMLAVAVAAAVSGHTEACAVTVTLTGTSALTPATEIQAKTLAMRIFDGIGVTLRWRHGSSCDVPVAISLDTSAAYDDRPGSLAYATVGADAGRKIHIFVDRVTATAGKDASGLLLGHVMAHEIAHVLEGVARHSATGIMKAHWDRRDLRTLRCHPLQFEPVDQALIHAGLIHAGLISTRATRGPASE